METKKKRLNILISLDIHCDIKKYAASRNMTMTSYIEAILFEQATKEKFDQELKENRNV